MKKLFLKIFSALLLFIVVPFTYGSVNAASLQFDKSTVSVTSGNSFSISVTVQPGSDALSSTDTYVTYDASYLTVGTVTAGELFPTVSHDESTLGKIYIAGMVNDPTDSISSAGTLATITFQAVKTGSTSLTFDCSTSKIIKNDINASDVMTCSQNGSSAISISGGSSGSTNPTSAPASTGGDDNSTTTELPQSGVLDSVAKIAVPGMLLLFLGSLLRLVL